MSHQHATRRVTTDIAAVDDAGCPILHVDMDAFFAAVELRRRPELSGRPMMVAGAAGRGVVLSATYEARAFGIRSAMPTGRALALCPGIMVIPPDHAAYAEASAEVMEVLRGVTPLLEQVSVDEAFLDVAGAVRRAGRPAQIARSIRDELRVRLRLPATVGVASTKFVAKLASSLAKPDGLLVVPPHSVAATLRPLPSRLLWGVGPKTAARLAAYGLVTVGDLVDLGGRGLAAIIGAAQARSLIDLANGRDDRRVTPETDEVSIGTERTFDTDVRGQQIVTATLLGLSGAAGFRLRKADYLARTVVLKVRFDDFTTVTRSETVPVPMSSDRDIYRVALRSWERLAEGDRPIRLLGVRLEGLQPRDDVSLQLTLAGDEDQWATAQQVVDTLKAKFGTAAPKPARLLPQPPRHGEFSSPSGMV